MSKIFSSLSNPSGDLGQLQHEFTDLFNFFNDKSIKKKVDFGFALNATIDELTSKIIAEQKEIQLFHFSGHSGKSGLDFPVSDFTTERVSKFFNTICSDESKIQCVFLNGCENEEIVNQLSAVPVVIGTRTKIQDTVARKFTQDYLSALIKSESTYRQAFLDAASAQNNLPITILDHTRSEGGRHSMTGSEALNDYFLVINDPNVAQQKFPFKKGKTNWTKYLFLLFAIIALFIGFILKDPILKLMRGYTCPNVKSEMNKCSFVIGDFTNDAGLDFNKWLFAQLEKTSLHNYFNYANIENFSDLIINNSIHRDSLPGHCGYDFNLTGSYVADNGSHVAEFNISPVRGKTISLESFPYKTESLSSLETLITHVDAKKETPFVLYELCIKCALNKNMPALELEMATFAKNLDSLRGTKVYQRFYYDLASLHLEYADTTSALKALDEVSTGRNNFSLAAIERKTSLYFSSHNIPKVYESQSNLMAEYELRITHPDQYELSGNVEMYKNGENNVRLDRARLVLQYKDGVLKDYRTIALQDFEYLQKINFPPGDFSKEIAELKETPPAPVVRFHLYGIVFTEHNEPLPGALLTFGNKTIVTDAGGQFDFGNVDSLKMINQGMLISHTGYHDKYIVLTGQQPGKIILTSNPEKISIIFQAVQTDEGQYQKLFSYLKKAGYQINSNYSKNFTEFPQGFSEISSVVYSKESDKEPANTLAQQLHNWTGSDVEVRFFTPVYSLAYAPKGGSDDIQIQLVGNNHSAPPPDSIPQFHLEGNVFNESGNPLYGATALFHDRTARTDEKGHFDFGSFPKKEVYGMPMTISHEGYIDATIKINEESIRKIVLKPANTKTMKKIFPK